MQPRTVYHDGSHFYATGRQGEGCSEYRCLEGGVDRRVWASDLGIVFDVRPGMTVEVLAGESAGERGRVESVSGQYAVVSLPDGALRTSVDNLKAA